MIDTQDNILEYARRNAVLQGYPYLENGLQPVEDYILDGVKHRGLKSKYEEHLLQVREVFLQSELKEKTRNHVIRQAATVYYYARQLEEQLQAPIWREALSAMKIYGVKERETVSAAEAIYAWRSEAKDNKDEDYEISLIEQANESLSRAGRPPKYGDASATARLDGRIPFTLRKALQLVVNDHRRQGEAMSVNQLVIEILSQDERVKRYLPQA